MVEFASLFPRLYHVADEANWEGIARHGLLSTSALLDLFEIDGAQRHSIESSRRRSSFTIEHAAHGRAIIRDQKAMDDSGLVRALRDELSPRDWYEFLNRHVFFWTSEQRVKRLLDAREYRHRRQFVLTIRTRDLLETYEENTLLSPMNSGATKPYPHPRSLDTFVPVTSWPVEAWRRKHRASKTAVELLVRGGVQDIRRFVDSVQYVDSDLGSQTGT